MFFSCLARYDQKEIPFHPMKPQVSQKNQNDRIKDCRNRSQAASSRRAIYSLALCARPISPGPQTTEGMPAFWKSPASEPKLTASVAGCAALLITWARKVFPASVFKAG